MLNPTDACFNSLGNGSRAPQANKASVPAATVTVAVQSHASFNPNDSPNVGFYRQLPDLIAHERASPAPRRIGRPTTRGRCSTLNGRSLFAVSASRSARNSLSSPKDTPLSHALDRKVGLLGNLGGWIG
jgi:hypothetical protein